MKYLNQESADMVVNKVTDIANMLKSRKNVEAACDNAFRGSSVRHGSAFVELNTLYDPAVADEVVELADSVLKDINAIDPFVGTLFVQSVRPREIYHYDKDGNEYFNSTDHHTAEITIQFIRMPEIKEILEYIESHVLIQMNETKTFFEYCGESNRDILVERIKAAIEAYSENSRHKGHTIIISECSAPHYADGTIGQTVIGEFTGKLCVTVIRPETVKETFKENRIFYIVCGEPDA